MNEKRLKTSLGEIEYQTTCCDIKKIVRVTIGKYYNAHFIFIEDAIKFVELAISGGADPREIKIIISFYKEGEDKDATED